MVDRATPRRERFDTLFAADPDPWDFETSSYERSKRAQTIAALGCRRFRIALEIGCATGVLTKELAKVCDRIIGIDVSDCALSIAQKRLRDISNIELRQGEIPNEWPAGLFNLVVFSEVLYFLSEQEIRDASARARQSMTGNGVCLLVNWTGPTDLPLDGHEVVELFTEAGHWNCIGAMQAPNFRIEKFELL
ncbi:class I SAM-dependent methyltransferase [Erythrobacter sp. SD-21]|uniref:class I SAM-dependent DNA methyltransferase n=1 Tax=Erythrobacter sp. SD-21 TaxID=161528 RepID=UPI000153F6E7|nr:SAM-dependent methyltransferase [Erythrobacter sp. SD-21]EDL48059.1 Methyltransferase type 12 [Erythrobacter sp. SD-21]